MRLVRCISCERVLSRADKVGQEFPDLLRESFFHFLFGFQAGSWTHWTGNVIRDIFCGKQYVIAVMG